MSFGSGAIRLNNITKVCRRWATLAGPGSQPEDWPIGVRLRTDHHLVGLSKKSLYINKSVRG